MLQHFKFEPMFENHQLPGWNLSFYYKSEKFRAEYQPDGTIDWLTDAPDDEEAVKKMIHELMLFHVYD